MKWPEREADHSIPSSAEVDNGDTIISLPHTPSWLGAQLQWQLNIFSILSYVCVFGLNFFVFYAVHVISKVSRRLVASRASFHCKLFLVVDNGLNSNHVLLPV